MATTGVNQQLQQAYDSQYTDRLTQWREMVGKQKAENILAVCQGRQFTKVLECGAGEGSILKFLDASGAFPELHALEISDSGIEKIRERNLPRIKGIHKFNGYETTFADNEFDMVYCSHVLEHVEHPRLLLRELKRISRYQVFEVPLEYSNGIDARVKDFLALGHINIYTPGLFRFLLFTEGFRINGELLTHMQKDVIRFNWYSNMGIRKTPWREFKLHVYFLRKYLKRMLLGRRHYEEYCHSAYTCLAEGVDDLSILQVGDHR